MQVSSQLPRKYLEKKNSVGLKTKNQFDQNNYLDNK